MYVFVLYTRESTTEYVLELKIVEIFKCARQKEASDLNGPAWEDFILIGT
jgi:hypothetical protein